MHMIWLYCHFKHVPIVFLGNLTNKLLSALRNLAYQDASPRLGTPDHVVHDEMHGMLFVSVLHVRSVSHINILRQHMRAQPIPIRNALHPCLESTGLSCELSCNAVDHAALVIADIERAIRPNG